MVRFSLRQSLIAIAVLCALVSIWSASRLSVVQTLTSGDGMHSVVILSDGDRLFLKVVRGRQCLHAPIEFGRVIHGYDGAGNYFLVENADRSLMCILKRTDSFANIPNSQNGESWESLIISATAEVTCDLDTGECSPVSRPLSQNYLAALLADAQRLHVRIWVRHTACHRQLTESNLMRLKEVVELEGLILGTRCIVGEHEAESLVSLAHLSTLNAAYATVKPDAIPVLARSEISTLIVRADQLPRQSRGLFASSKCELRFVTGSELYD